MATRFKPGSPLEEAIYQGNRRSVIAVLGRMDYAERQKLRPQVMRLFKLIDKANYSYGDRTHAGWGRIPSVEQHHALAAAMFLCGTAKDVAKSFYETRQLIELARQYPPPWLAELGSELDGIHDLQALIAEKMIQRPERDDYILGLMSLFSGRLREATTIDAAFKADPGLKEVLLRVMEVEGTQEVSLAALDKYRSGPVSWADRLKELSERGIYPRAVLIEKAVAALERGWNQFRSGWFSSFHGLMKPSVKEMKPLANRYLGLLGSRTPPTVTFALGCVEELDEAGELDARELLEALGPVFSSAVKSQVEAGLRIVDRLVKRDGSLAPQAAKLILPGLGHSAANLQKQVLARLGEWDPERTTRAGLASYAKSIAAVNREAFRGLMGAVAAPKRAPARLPMPVPRGISDPLDVACVVEPIASFDELVEKVAYVLENEADVEEFERALAGLVRHAPFDQERRARFGAVAKRLPKVRRHVPGQLARLLQFLQSGEKAPTKPDGQNFFGHPDFLQRHTARRIEELMESVDAGAGLVPLATPTHQRGFIEPSELVKRLAARQAKGVVVGPIDFVTALMRMAPGGAPAALGAARKLADDEFSRALRHALGDDVKVRGRELSDAAKRMRALVDGGAAKSRGWRVLSKPQRSGKTLTAVKTEPSMFAESHDPVAVLVRQAAAVECEYWFELAAVGNADEGSVGLFASLLPADLEDFCAEGAEIFSRNLDWWQAQWQNKAYLRPLLSPSAPVGPMATLLLALALAGKEAGQTAVAVDVLVQSTLDGRLDAKLLGADVAELARSGHASCARYAKSLGAALRIDEAVAPVAAEVVSAVVAVRPGDAPRDTAALLELLLELVHGKEVELTDTTRAALESLQIGGKGRSLRRQLLNG